MGGRYIDDGQYDHHVWLWRTYQQLMMDRLCYGSCFIMYTAEYGLKRIDPRDIIIHEH